MPINENLKRGTSELLILYLLSKEDMYGYQICKELEEKSEGLFIVKEGTLYPILYRLIGKGIISDYQKKVGERRTRVYYHLEETGKTYLEELKNDYFHLTKGILNVLENKPFELRG